MNKFKIDGLMSITTEVVIGGITDKQDKIDLASMLSAAFNSTEMVDLLWLNYKIRCMRNNESLKEYNDRIHKFKDIISDVVFEWDND